jgi:hypothetical protein
MPYPKTLIETGNPVQRSPFPRVKDRFPVRSGSAGTSFALVPPNSTLGTAAFSRDTGIRSGDLLIVVLWKLNFPNLTPIPSADRVLSSEISQNTIASSPAEEIPQRARRGYWTLSTNTLAVGDIETVSAAPRLISWGRFSPVG